MREKFSEPTQAQTAQQTIQKRETNNPLDVIVNNANISPIKIVDIESDTLKYAIAVQAAKTKLIQSKTIKIFSPISVLKIYENGQTLLNNQLP
jgi:hypothetical protein